MIARLFRRRTAAAAAPEIPPGERVYAIGDVHGHGDQLAALLDAVAQDDAARGPATITVVMLGDLIDRGPDSAGVVAQARALAAASPRARFLMGNHEEMLLAALGGDMKALKIFARVGGYETMLSYGLDPADYERADYDELLELLRAVVPPADVAFVEHFEDMVIVGDYAFVHAGIDPALPLEAQQGSDLRWIRRRFLEHDAPLEKMIVHGHSISPEVEFRPHRIGIDTGAYAGGPLTALGLEGTERWIIQR